MSEHKADTDSSYRWEYLFFKVSSDHVFPWSQLLEKKTNQNCKMI